MNELEKTFPITSLTRYDILDAFKGNKNLPAIKKRVKKMSDAEMEKLAGKMADDYINQLFWESLRINFEMRFMEGE